MDLGGLVRAGMTGSCTEHFKFTNTNTVTAAFQDGAKLVTRIRDDRADSDRALPEDPTRDLLDSLQLGPLLVKGQYDRDHKRFGEQLVCGDAQAREQMKDVLINLQMALIISLRGVSLDNNDLDFEALQQTSDDCRTNAGVCLGQLSQRLSDAAKAEAMMSESDLALPTPKYASIGYSSSRSTRSTHSSGRDPRTPPQSVHDDYAQHAPSNASTIRPPPKERRRANSSASKRGYQPKRPTTPQTQRVATTHPPTERRLRGVPSQEVLTPPDEETLRVIRNGYIDAQHAVDQNIIARASNGTRADSGYASASLASRRKPGYGVSMASSKSNASSHHTSNHPMPERLPHRTKFGGISSQTMSYASRDSQDEYGMSTLDDPTTSEEDDILSLRRPSSHALGMDEHEILSPTIADFQIRPESSARSYVVSLPDADLHDPHSPISVVSEGEEDEETDDPESPEMLHARTYRPGVNERHGRYELDDSTPTLAPGEFGHATVYETSRIRPAESNLPAPRFRQQPRQDSLSRLRESRLITTNDLAAGRNTPQRSNEEIQATLRQAEARARHYRNRPGQLQHSESVRESTSPYANREYDPRMQHVGHMQQQARVPRHLADLPLPPPPGNERRPDSRGKVRAPQGYKVFPSPPAGPRGAPAPPPDTALPPPPGRGPKWLAEAQSTGFRPPASPGLPPTPASTSAPDLRPTAPAVKPSEPEISALPEDGPGPSEKDHDSPPATAISKTSTNSSGQRMVKVVPMHMAMYGGVYTGAPVSKKPKYINKPIAPPLPNTMPLTLPTEKYLLGFCKGAHRLFLGLDKSMKINSRPVGLAGNMHFWVCNKCHFQGPVSSVSKMVPVGRKGKEKLIQDKIYDPNPRPSPIRGLDGETGGVRYKWVFLAKCHVPLKAMTEELAMGAGAAGKGEWGGFGCLFCAAEGHSRGWTDRDARGKLVVADGLSIMSGSTGSAETSKSSGGGGSRDTPIFRDLEGFMAHLEMHRKEDCFPGQEMMGRMRVIAGRVAQEGEEWEVNFLPFKKEQADDA